MFKGGFFMSYNNLVDLAADFSKLRIEMSWQSRDDKEFAKSTVDCLASILKQSPTNGFNSMQQIDFEWVKRIKVAAQKYSIDRVVVFPCPINNQRVTMLLRTYGEETAMFSGKLN